MIDTGTYTRRRDALRDLLRQQNLDALLVSLAANRYYLSGFELHNPQENESAGMLLVTANGPDILYTDPRYKDAALSLWDERRLCIYSGSAPEVIAESMARQAPGEVGVEAQAVSLSFFDALKAALPSAVTLRKASMLVESLRRIKEPDEIDRIQTSCDLNHAMMRWLPTALDPRKSEAQLAWEIETFFREHGASELAFSTIVAYGANAAQPHCLPGQGLPRAEELVLVDAGCRVRQYCSDQTRTFWLGDNPSSRFRETLALVQEAQQRAIDLIRPGAPGREVYQAAWQTFERLGVAASFTHGLGHGVGLETHEAPSLGRLSDAVLEPGMIVTVEPGLYDPAWGGVRWEYMVLVTDHGCRVM